jgi:hypothetical protein
VKVVFILSFVLSGVFMYFLAQEFFGRFGGLISSAFYIFAPYHSVDVYVRGAMNEAWALVFFPVILWTSYRLIRSDSGRLRWIILLALSWFGLLTSHNLMVLIFTPIFSVWCGAFLLYYKRFRTVPSLLLSGILAFGLAAFFTLPVAIEQKFVHADTLVQGYYDFSVHFVSLKQLLFNRYFGFGSSIWESLDGMSFQIGIVHVMAGLAVGFLVLYRIYKSRRISVFEFTTAILLFAGLFAAFMTHSKSTPLWQHFAPLAYVQFPWRWLTLVILGISFSAGYLSVLIPKTISPQLTVVIITICILSALPFFEPETGKLGPLTDEQKFSGIAWDMQRTAGIMDYLPKTAIENPREGANTIASTVTGMGQFSDIHQGTDWADFTSTVSTPESLVRLNIFQFPDWKIFVNGQSVTPTIPSTEKWGRMYITLPRGTSHVEARLYDTPIRTLANSVSVLSWIALLFIVFFHRKRILHA